MIQWKWKQSQRKKQQENNRVVCVSGVPSTPDTPLLQSCSRSSIVEEEKKKKKKKNGENIAGF